MQFTITHWGCTPSGDSIYLFRLTNATGASIELTNLGATWVSANMPNRYDVFENILLGYDKVEGYLKDTYYMGATVGRFANRIHQASFSIEGTTYLLEKAKPVYKTLPGWKCEIRGIKNYEDLPENCRKYVEFIEEQIGFPITMVSNGPGRDDIIYR